MTNVLYGVTGGIAAYKAPNLVRDLTSNDYDIQVVLTEGAEQFTTPMALQTVSENRVGTELFDLDYEGDIGHIELGRWADVVLVAPATADAVAKMANGFADDLLTTVLLATNAPIVVSPSMNTQMLKSASVRRNLDRLRGWEQYRMVEPDSGVLACREEGQGRMPDPEILAEYVDMTAAEKPLAGKKVVITAGPTRESIDPVRFLSNPSTGQMGYALARWARNLGASVSLISGPTDQQAPPEIDVIPVESAEQMANAVLDRDLTEVDIFAMAAAVCDWRPKESFDHKQAKSEMSSRLELERTRDILASLSDKKDSNGYDYDLIGFAAETQNIEQRVRDKFERKGVDLIVGNSVSRSDSAFGHSKPELFLVAKNKQDWLGPDTKYQLARRIWEYFV